MKTQQPKIKKGFELTGWTTFNWGICHNQVWRTRKEAKENLEDWNGQKWNKIKDHFRIEKVKCIVI